MKRYVMIGAPVSAVRTPPLLEAYMAAQGVSATVETRHLEAAQLGAFVAAVRAGRDIDGLLVTMPHKKTLPAYLDTLTTVAAAAGSVNAVKRLASGALAGAQFDGLGLCRALLARGVDPAGARVLLAGVGGAGLAIARALLAHGCRHLAITEADRRLREAVLRDLRTAGGVVPSASAAGNGEHGEHDILINATPLGMRDDDPSPFSASAVARAEAIADIVADPPRTRLAALAQRSGRILVSGRDMVNGQVALIGDWLLGADRAGQQAAVVRSAIEL